MTRIVAGLLALLSVTLGTGCAYSVRRSNNPLLAEMGIHRLYIDTFKNKTFKPGVDITVQSAIEKMIRAQAQVEIVRSPEDADSVLRAEIVNARYQASASTTGNRLQPTTLGEQFGNYTVATVYLAYLSCVVELQKRRDLKPLWKTEFGRSKTFPGSNQLGLYGTTSSLINESEFERALDDLSSQIALDVHESMVGIF